MIISVKKIPILRYCLIILAFSALFLIAFYLYLHNQKAQKLQYNINNVISARENSTLIDSCILNLYNADNYTRLYTVTGNKEYLQKFTADINKISDIIGKIKFDGRKVAELNPEKFRGLMKAKAQKTDAYIKLRLLTDSLIRYSLSVNQSLNQINKRALNPQVKVEHVITLDTIKSQKNNVPKKKFIGRIFSVFSKKNKEEIPAPIVIRRDTVTTSTTITKASPSTTRQYNQYYNKLNTINNRLRHNEQQMLVINNNLIQEIITSLKLYQAVEQLYIKKSKMDLKENLADIFFQFKQLSVINYIFFIALIILVFYNIWKIFRNDQEIIEYSGKAEQYALSKSRFLASMSHEIRTPLNSVIGFAEQLSQEELLSTQKEQVDAIKNSSDMLLELVNEILDFSKYEIGKMNFENSPFQVSKALEDTFNNMQIHAIKKHITLVNEILVDPELFCDGDKMRLQQVVMNLIGNAVKFTVKGNVTLRAIIENKENERTILKVTITDTGLGIDKNDLPFIFDEFSQVATAQKATRHKGTGLGLAICKKIIELQGGQISVTSIAGQGSSFIFTLPLTKCEKLELDTSQTMTDDLMADLVKNKYVLFVEDDKLNILLGTTILKKWKIKYDVAYNGHEALTLFEQNNYDLILTDIQMPEMNGLELTEVIRSLPDYYKSTIQILALTGNVMKEDRDLYFQTGINDVILKPFREKVLIEKIAITLQNNVLQ